METFNLDRVSVGQPSDADVIKAWWGKPLADWPWEVVIAWAATSDPLSPLSATLEVTHGHNTHDTYY